MIPSALRLNSVYPVLLSYCKNNAVRECNMHISTKLSFSTKNCVLYTHKGGMVLNHKMVELTYNCHISESPTNN